jgi:hypothetical protein
MVIAAQQGCPKPSSLGEPGPGCAVSCCLLQSRCSRAQQLPVAVQPEHRASPTVRRSSAQQQTQPIVEILRTVGLLQEQDLALLRQRRGRGFSVAAG